LAALLYRLPASNNLLIAQQHLFFAPYHKTLLDYRMKLSSLALLAAVAVPASAEIFLKEQFNDDVSFTFVVAFFGKRNVRK